MQTKRGRPSLASVETSVVAGAFNPQARPPAPDVLDKEQAEIWDAAVNTQPLEFFATEVTQNLLANYCRHQVSVNHVSVVINAFDLDELETDSGLRRYTALVRVRDAESKAAMNLASRLRLTNQARFTSGHASTISKNDTKKSVNLWEFGK